MRQVQDFQIGFALAHTSSKSSTQLEITSS